MIKGVILLILFTIIAFIIGKLVSKLKLPSILGWLITGMMIGPHALNWMNSNIMDTQWYHILTNVGEILVGMLIGTELIIEELKKSGKQILTICLFEGMTAFILVAIAFFIFTDMPMSIALVIGAIALATAPAPSLSIVKEYNAKGPVSKTLIPLAALDDVLGLIVFFLVIGVVSGGMTGESVNIISILMMIILPLAIGGVINPIIGIGLIVMVINLGAPLDYNLIFGAEIFTAIYNSPWNRKDFWSLCRRQVIEG